jgi:hypothetical protein
MNHDQVTLSAVTYLFLVLSIILTLLRCYTRFYILKSWGSDDVTSVLGLVRLEITVRFLRFVLTFVASFLLQPFW